MKVIKYIFMGIGVVILSIVGGFVGGKLTDLGKHPEPDIKNIPEEHRFCMMKMKELLLSPEINRDSIFIYFKKLEELRYKRDSIRLSNFIKKIEPLEPEQRIKYIKRIGPHPIRRNIKPRRIK